MKLSLRASSVFYSSLVVCCTLGLSACDSAPTPPPTGQISGTVLLDDQPLPDGEIYFVNVGEGVNQMLPIKDGKFAGPASLGERKVEIRAYKEVQAEAAAGMYEDEAATTSKENYIPAEYNTDSTLTATIEDGKTYEFEVTSSE